MVFATLFIFLSLVINAIVGYIPTQPAITCSKLTIETPEQGKKYVQSKEIRTTPFVVVLMYLLTLNIFHNLF